MFTVSTDNFDLGWDGCMATLETAGLYTALKRKLKVKGTEMCVLHVLCSFSVAVCFCMCVFFFCMYKYKCLNMCYCHFYALTCHHNVCMCLHVSSIQIQMYMCTMLHYLLRNFSMPACVLVSVCACVCVCSPSSGPPLMCVPHVRVLYTQHYVVVGAGVGVLS